MIIKTILQNTKFQRLLVQKNIRLFVELKINQMNNTSSTKLYILYQILISLLHVHESILQAKLKFFPFLVLPLHHNEKNKYFRYRSQHH